MNHTVSPLRVELTASEQRTARIKSRIMEHFSAHQPEEISLRIHEIDYVSGDTNYQIFKVDRHPSWILWDKQEIVTYNNPTDAIIEVMNATNIANERRKIMFISSLPIISADIAFLMIFTIGFCWLENCQFRRRSAHYLLL